MDPMANVIEQIGLLMREAKGEDVSEALEALREALRDWIEKGGFVPVSHPRFNGTRVTIPIKQLRRFGPRVTIPIKQLRRFNGVSLHHTPWIVWKENGEVEIDGGWVTVQFHES
jgi:hypothetical protein